MPIILGKFFSKIITCYTLQSVVHAEFILGTLLEKNHNLCIYRYLLILLTKPKMSSLSTS